MNVLNISTLTSFYDGITFLLSFIIESPPADIIIVRHFSQLHVLQHADKTYDSISGSSSYSLSLSIYSFLFFIPHFTFLLYLFQKFFSLSITFKVFPLSFTISLAFSLQIHIYSHSEVTSKQISLYELTFSKNGFEIKRTKLFSVED